MAGFVKFDPYKWEPSEPVGLAKVAKAVKAGPTLATLAGLAALPADLADGLERLNHMAMPQIIIAEAWPLAVADAHRLARGGWVAQALALGWSALDLFGAVPDKLGNPNADGLAVKLKGRPVLAICSSFATVQDGPNARSFTYRGNNEGAVLLWEVGTAELKAVAR